MLGFLFLGDWRPKQSVALRIKGVKEVRFPKTNGIKTCIYAESGLPIVSKFSIESTPNFLGIRILVYKFVFRTCCNPYSVLVVIQG